MENTVLKVDGMTCQGCVRSVTRVLQALPGVEKVEVSLEKGEAALAFDPSQTSIADFKRAVTEAGFEA